MARRPLQTSRRILVTLLFAASSGGLASGASASPAVAAPAVQAFFGDLAGFDAVAGAPVKVTFDDLAHATDIEGAVLAGATFSSGPGDNAAPVVVRAADTVTPEGFGSGGIFDPADNTLIATSGANVVSPGGPTLSPGPDPSVENDDLVVGFSPRVSAVGFDLLLQSLDGYSGVSVRLLDPSGAVLYANDLIPSGPEPQPPGAVPPGAPWFVGFVSPTRNIATLVIDEYDDDGFRPDSNIGFDTFRFSAAPRPGTIAVVPATGLSGGDLVDVELGGFAPFASLGWAQCLVIGPSGADDCSPPIGQGTADASGALTGSYRVQRFIYVPSAARWVDCADPGESCVIGAADITDIAGTAVASGALGFAPPPEPPAVRGTIAVVPWAVAAPGAVVTVTGSGFRPDSFVEVFQCEAAPVDPSACNLATASATTDSTGGFTVDITVVGTVQPGGGSATDCFTTPGACVFAAAEAVDFPGTVAFTPLVILPTVLPGVGSVGEGDSGTGVLEVPVRLSSPAGVPVTVGWRTIFYPSWTFAAAEPGVDYEAASGVVTFAPGETEQTASIVISGDLEAELDELLVVSFGLPANARLGGYWGLGFGVITDDDTLPVITPGGVGVWEEGDSGSRFWDLPVRLSSPSDVPVSIDWATIDTLSAPLAQAGDDFVAASGTVTFQPGETVQNISLEILGDTLAEPPLLWGEWGLVSFTNPTNATLNTTTFYGLGLFIIVDDDP